MPRSTSGGGHRSSGSSHRASTGSRGSSHHASSPRGSSSVHHSASSMSRPSGSHTPYRPSAPSAPRPPAHRPPAPPPAPSAYRPASRPSYSAPRPPSGGGGVFVPYQGTGTAAPVAQRRGSGIGTIVAAVVLIVLVFAIAGVMTADYGSASSRVPESTANRDKLDTGCAYDSDCVIDEIGWIDNESRLSRNLQDFYAKTGCQPFIYMKAYDPSCSTDPQLEDWAADYYDTHFADRQHVVFYAYACETPDPDDDTGDGWQNLQLGTQSALVMDAEALDIFWNYLDADWSTWDPSDNDGMYADIFNKTASRIMQKTTTKLDVAKTALIAVMVVGAGVCVIIIMKLRRKHAAQAAAETAAILSAPLGPTTAQSEADRLASQYTGTGTGTGTGTTPPSGTSGYSGPGGTLE